MGPDNTSSVRAAIQPSALRAALVPHRPVFRNPWDSEEDMFACLRGRSALPIRCCSGPEAS